MGANVVGEKVGAVGVSDGGCVGEAVGPHVPHETGQDSTKKSIVVCDWPAS